MGWESRNGNYYYYRKRWLNGACVSEYLGQGSLAEAISTLEQLEREEKQLKRDLWQQELADIESVDRQIDELCTHIRTITRIVLRATGHHRHKGQWRKKRMAPQTTLKEKVKRFNKLLFACNADKPNAEDVKGLRKTLRDMPNLARSIDLGTQVAPHLIDEILASKAVKEVLQTRYDLLLTDLGYHEAPALEQLLIWQVALCWLRLAIVERYYTQEIDNKITLTKADWWERRLSASQRRFLRACETLTRVRKLASRTPEILMVNIADKQVNQVNQT